MAGLSVRSLLSKRQPSGIPGMKAAIQIGPIVVTDHIQCPAQPTSPAAAFVIKCDDPLFGLITNSAKSGLDLGEVGQLSRSRRNAANQL